MPYGWCPDLGLKPDSTGRSASSSGERLSPVLKIVGHFADADRKDTSTRALWLARAPALTQANYRNHSTWLTWTGPSATAP